MTGNDVPTGVRFEQHIFAGDPYGTVAKSDGLAGADCEAIERHAARYDVKRAANEYRAFALPGRGQGDDSGDDRRYAVMAARAVPGLRGNNFLAHSHIVPASALARVSGNWAWLTLRLPPLEEYQPLRSRVERLAPIERAIDPTGQFRFFRFVVAEQTPERVEELLCAMLRYLEKPGGKPLVLDLGPPHPELASLLQLTFAVPPSTLPTVPSAPDLALLRMVGLLAPLPLCFQLHASYALHAVTTGVDCAFVVDDDAERPRLDLGHGTAVRYARRCVTLAQGGDEAALHQLKDLQGWMSRMVSVASTRTLDTTYKVYEELPVGNSDPNERAPVRASVLADQLGQLARSGHVRVGDLLEVASRAGIEDRSLAERLQIWCALAPRLTSRDELPDAIAADVIEGLAATSRGLRACAIEVFRSFAPALQVQVWTEAASSTYAPPAALGELVAGVTVETLRAAEHAGVPMLAQLIESMPDRASTSVWLPPELTQLVGRLQGLAHIDADIAEGVLPVMVDEILDRTRAPREEPRFARLSEAVDALVHSPQLFARGRPAQVAEVVALAIAACCRWVPHRFDSRIVLDLPAVERRGEMRLILDALVPLARRLHPVLARVVEVQSELVRAVDACADKRHRHELLSLPCYAGAIEALRKPGEARAPWADSPGRDFDRIHEGLRREVMHASPAAALLLGASYLSYHEGHVALFIATMHRAKEIPWASHQAAFSLSLRASMLAELFAASERCKLPVEMEDVSSALAVEGDEAGTLCSMIGQILNEHNRAPPAWQALQKSRNGRRWFEKPRRRS
jgi:hypothetical protein